MTSKNSQKCEVSTHDERYAEYSTRYRNILKRELKPVDIDDFQNDIFDS